MHHCGSVRCGLGWTPPLSRETLRGPGIKGRWRSARVQDPSNRSAETGSVFAVNVGPDRFWFNDDGSFTLQTTGNVESLHGPGNGDAYQDVGFTEVIINGEDVQFVRAPGQHDGDHDEVLCGLLR